MEVLWVFRHYGECCEGSYWHSYHEVGCPVPILGSFQIPSRHWNGKDQNLYQSHGVEELHILPLSVAWLDCAPFYPSFAHYHSQHTPTPWGVSQLCELTWLGLPGSSSVISLFDMCNALKILTLYSHTLTCQQMFAATKHLSTGLPNLGCGKRRNFIQINRLRKQSLWWKAKILLLDNGEAPSHRQHAPPWSQISSFLCK